jgi:hypothetical protein
MPRRGWQHDGPVAGVGGAEPDVHDLSALRDHPDRDAGRLDQRRRPGSGGGHDGVGGDPLPVNRHSGHAVVVTAQRGPAGPDRRAGRPEQCAGELPSVHPGRAADEDGPRSRPQRREHALRLAVGQDPDLADLRCLGPPGHDPSPDPLEFPVIVGEGERAHLAVGHVFVAQAGHQGRVLAHRGAGKRVPGRVLGLRCPRADDPGARGRGPPHGCRVDEGDVRAQPARGVPARRPHDPRPHHDQPHERSFSQNAVSCRTVGHNQACVTCRAVAR